FSDLPVAILAWVLGSMSGLTRTEIRAVRPLPLAMDDSSSSSASDSTLTQRMPSSTASASSAAVLPMPENMILSGAMPAARARLRPPCDNPSAPPPRGAGVLNTFCWDFRFRAEEMSVFAAAKDAEHHSQGSLRGARRWGRNRGGWRPPARDQRD